MSDNKRYDVVVIGGGPGGYVAAIECARHGMRTACIDSWLSAEGKAGLGGTCLNCGCIPSKALLDSSHHFHNARQEMAAHGVITGEVELNLQTMMRRKDNIVKTLGAGVSHLVQKNGAEWIKGHARLLGNGRIEVSQMGEQAGEQLQLEAENIIIATGSVPASIPCAVTNHHNIIDSTGALQLDSVPERLGIIGAGVIGMELGSVWNRLGSEVTLFEAMPKLLPTADQDISRAAERMLKGQGLKFELDARVEKTSDNGRQVKLVWSRPDGSNDEASFDKLIVATGRSPNTSGLGATDAGIELDEKGFIVTDQNWRTSVEGIYAIGDVTPGPMLAHRASADAHRLAESIVGKPQPTVNNNTIPWVIYTWPEIAWVGDVSDNNNNSGTFKLMASGRARCMGETEGFIKLVSNPDNNRLTGAHIMAANASELVAEAVAALECQATADDLAYTVHAHPTLAEGMHEAALAMLGKPLHG